MKKVILSFILGIIVTASFYTFFERDKHSEMGKISGMTKEEKIKTLQKLSVEVQINYFENLLGKPTYINVIPLKDPPKIEQKFYSSYYENLKEGFFEYVFIDENFYVQAITDSNKKTLSYAVTSRKEDFNPSFEMPILFKVSLNKTPFSEYLSSSEDRYHPQVCFQFVGAHTPIYYFEKSYFGNPGNYLYYLVGLSDIAWPGEIPAVIEEVIETPTGLVGEWWWGPGNCKNVNQEDRERLAPNTFIVWTSTLDSLYTELRMPSESMLEFFGPSYTQVRTLNE